MKNSMIDAEEKNTVRENWLKASKKIQFKIITPYILGVMDKEVSVFAFIPEYGSAKGTIIELLDDEDRLKERDASCAKENGFYHSYINAKAYLDFDENKICETLMDWGYFGDPRNKPSWLRQSPWA